MGCICSTTGSQVASNDRDREKESNNSTTQLMGPAFSNKEVGKTEHAAGVKDLSGGRSSRSGNVITIVLDNGVKRPVIVGVPSRNLSRKIQEDSGGRTQQQQQHQRLPSLSRVSRGGETELTVAGWPSWLASVAGDAIKGWLPRSAESFEKLDKIGQGTYSSVYKAQDLETGKIVAMKKVRFVNMDPESVRFMAREIHILRKLDHPNVMKLEGLVTSRLSGSLYLVFEYMEHDLAGLAANPSIKFTESQIKCYMQQLIRGLQHCHRRGILHRDIKGSNLLINDNGVLKIGDFGLANFYHPDQDQPLTSRVVTLWYRAPELLLGASLYGAAIDMWSAGCILAELFAGKPIMPGRTEVEQMHKIFKLCGSPSEDYWETKKLPLETSYKPPQPYKRVLAESFKSFPSSALALVDKLLTIEPEKRGSASSALRSEFFTKDPLPSDPSSLPKYPPSKELDVKLRNEESRKQKADVASRQGAETVRRVARDAKRVGTPEFVAAGQSKVICNTLTFKTDGEGGTGFRIDPPRRSFQHNGYSHATSMVHPTLASSSWNKSGSSTRQPDGELKAGRSQAADFSDSSHRMDSEKDSATGNMPKKNRIHYSGPLMPPGGNIEDILKEHDRQIRQAVRKSRQEKSATMKNQQIYIGRYAR